MSRYVVVLQRSGMDLAPLVEWQEQVAVGPFRTRERAEQRAATIRRLAETYEDPPDDYCNCTEEARPDCKRCGGTGIRPGTTGPDNALDVFVTRLGPSRASAQDVLAAIYGESFE
jgi:hypothetical protein